MTFCGKSITDDVIKVRWGHADYSGSNPMTGVLTGTGKLGTPRDAGGRRKMSLLIGVMGP